MLKVRNIVVILFLTTIQISAGIFGMGNNDIYHNNWIDFNKNGTMDPYENQQLDTKKRVADLLHRMNLKEKTCQMATLYGYGAVLQDSLPTDEWKDTTWQYGIGNIDEHLNGRKETELNYPHSKLPKSLNQVQKFFVEETRLGIPVDFTNEGIRGLKSEKTTSFPAQIGVASTWNKDLVEKIGHITGKEAKVLGYTNVYSPILDLARDPRWGRTPETYGESPFLVSELGKIMGKSLQEEGIVSTAKHYCIYSRPKGGRDGNVRTAPHLTEREVKNLYLEPFREVIKESDIMGVMSSYNEYNGIPISGSKHYLQDQLDLWDFDGYIVSDSRAVGQIHEKHEVATNFKDAVRHTVKGGLNIRTDFTPPSDYIDPLRELVKEGKISHKTINERVKDILKVKFELGLFDQPYVPNPGKADKIVNNKNFQETAKNTARESIVLLKNEKQTLPLQEKNIQSILVTGPNSKTEDHSRGGYGPNRIDVVSVLEGISENAPENMKVNFTKGCPVKSEVWPQNEVMYYEEYSDNINEMMKRGIRQAKNNDVIIAVMGENEEIVGEARSRTSLDLPPVQRKYLRKLENTGKPIILVLINGRPLTINWADKNIPAILEGWFPGKHCGTAVADVIFGKTNPSGKLPITFPKTVGQLPYNFPYKKGSQRNQLDGWAPGERTRIDGALYPFGHGLSYTSFKYSGLQVKPKEQGPRGNITVQCTIKNNGDREGAEIAQLYVKDLFSSVVTYEKELKGFKKVDLKPGESQTVTFKLQPNELELLDRNMNWTVEPGKFNVQIGSSSRDIRLKDSFHIVK